MLIDALGQACPLPVIRAKQAINAFPGETIEILVDNKIATENLKKLADQLGLSYKMEQRNENEFSVVLEGTAKKVEECQLMDSFDYIVAVEGDSMGKGDDVLSHKLIEGFIFALTEQDELPKYVIFYNSGVRLTTLNQKTIEDLKKLADKGVTILSCGLCLDFYNLKSELKIGEATNMYRILEIMRSYRVVKP